MSGSVSGLSQLGYAPYLGQNPFQLQSIQGVPGVSTQITEIANGNFQTTPSLLQQSQGVDSFTSSFGMLPQAASTPSFSNASINQNIPISQSSLEVMGSIASYMGSVTLGLGDFVQSLLTSYQARKAKEEIEGKTSSTSKTSASVSNPATQTALATSSSSEPEKKKTEETEAVM